MSERLVVESNQAYCVECGGLFPIEDMISHGPARICAGCKPAFLQKLAEGAEIRTGQLRYASVGTRFVAALLDGLLLLVASVVVQFVLLGLTFEQFIGVTPVTSVFVELVRQLFGLALGLSYEAFLIGKYGATLGKMACRIKVVTADGGKVSYGRAIGRHFAKFLSTITLMIGYIIAIFDSEKRALHDRICNTRVVIS
jgi:uncharacterized RDD family membrane protein YckC